MKQVPELVLPASNPLKTKIAFQYGADAVYGGLPIFSLRKAEVDFSLKTLGEAISFAKSINKKFYVTLNIFPKNAQIEVAKKVLKDLAKLEPSAFIISDPGLIMLAKELAPKIPIHLSTQANTQNYKAVEFWLNQNIKRVVLGREVTLKEVAEIKKKVPGAEIEIFGHGAMCISYSGRCLLSATMTGRSANFGICTQPCRWEYKVYLEEQKRPGQFFEIQEGQNATYIMNSKDLCTVEFVNEIIKAGVDALKIEGRNKSEYYLAIVTKTYKKALDLASQNKATKAKLAELKKDLLSLANREYTTGFLFNDAKKGETYNERNPLFSHRYCGFVLGEKSGLAIVEVKNLLEIGKEYELITPEKTIKFKIKTLKKLDGKSLTKISAGKAGEKVLINVPEIIENSIIRSEYVERKN